MNGSMLTAVAGLVPHQDATDPLPGGGLGGGVEDVLFSDTFFGIFFALGALLVVAGFVTTIVMVIRRKGRRYIVMEVNDDGTVRPVGMPGMGFDSGLASHSAAHQQAMQPGMNQQIFNQQSFPTQPPPGI